MTIWEMANECSSSTPHSPRLPPSRDPVRPSRSPNPGATAARRHGQGRAGVRDHRRRRSRRRRLVVVVLGAARVRAGAGADAASAGAARVRGHGAARGDEPRAGSVGHPDGARSAVVGPRRAGARRHGRRRGVRHHGPRRAALRGARARRVLRHCGALRAALRLLLHRIRRRHARRRRRLQLPPRHLRGVRGVPDGGEPDHGVRLLQRRRGAQLHGVPGHGGRRGRAQQVADPSAGPARRVQPGGPCRRRRHPPALRLHLLQHQGELGGEPGADGGARGVHPLHHRDGVRARRRAEPVPPRRPRPQPRRLLPARRGGGVQRRRRGVPELHRLRRRVHHGRGSGAARPRHPRRRLRLRRPRHRALLPHGCLHVHAPPLRRDRPGGAVLGGVQGAGRDGVGVERHRRRRQPRHPHVAHGGHAGAGPVPVRHRPLRRRARLARPGRPPHRHPRQCLRLPRPADGGAGAVHGAGRAPEPRLHRHALRLLHGGKRRRVPPLRRRPLPGRHRHRTRDEGVADAGVHRGLLPDRALLHAAVAVRAGGRRQGRDAVGDRGGRRGRGRRVPGAGAAGAGARGVGRARDAMGARRVRLPQRLPARLAGPPVVRPVRLLLRRRRAGLRALQRARQLRCRGGRRRGGRRRRRRRRRQAAGPWVRGVAESLT